MGVNVWFDCLQPRLVQGVVCVSVDGRSWDPLTLSDAIVDPITQTLFLRPYQLRDDWATTTSGSYARLGVGDFETVGGTPLPSTEWKENHRRAVGDIYLESQGVNYGVFTATPLDENRGIHLSFYVPDGSDIGKTVIECGWGEPGDPDTVSLFILGGGRVQVFVGTEMVGSGSISGAAQEVRTVGQVTTAASAALPNDDVVGRVVNLYLIPARKRELLILSATGDGFSHTFTDLDPEAPYNVITVAGRFWWQVPQGKASVQCVPLTYPTSGYGQSVPWQLRVAPEVGDVFEYVDAWDEAGPVGTVGMTSSLRESPAGTAYTPDGIIDTVALRASMTGDGLYTPFVYALDAVLPAKTEDTDDSELTDIADYVLSMNLSVPEDPGGARLTITGKDPGGMGIAGPEWQANRPIEIAAFEGALFWHGDSGDAPEITEGKTPAAQRVAWQCRDLWARLDAARYEDSPPALDGFTLTDAIGALLSDAGIPDALWDIETSVFTIPFTTACSKGEWAFRPEAGSTVADNLIKVWKTFAPTWVMRWVPTASGPRFVFRSEDDLGAEPVATIYMDREGDFDLYACKRFREKTNPAEATRLSVIGYDPALRTILRDRRTDTSLEAPTLAPSAKPRGHVGEIRPVGVSNPRLVTQDGVTRAADQLEERLGGELRIAYWTARFVPRTDDLPVWPGDVVRIIPGASAYVAGGDYRVLSMGGTIRKMNDEAYQANLDYVGKRIADLPEPEEEP